MLLQMKKLFTFQSGKIQIEFSLRKSIGMAVKRSVPKESALFGIYRSCKTKYNLLFKFFFAK